MADSPKTSEMYRFAHEAMATTFEVMVAAKSPEDVSEVYARQAAQAAFKEIDRIEKDLSRYVDSSDISRVNHWGAREPVRVSIDTFECLRLAQQLCKDTGGAFDVTIGPLMACWRTEDGKMRTPSPDEISAARARVGSHNLELDPDKFEVRTNATSTEVDLGGIGKGYALDKAAEALHEWSIDSALLNGGDSTALALEAPPNKKGWAVAAGGTERTTPRKIMLPKGALSGSGLTLKGRHIMDPRTGYPAKGAMAAWARCPSAARADALSTAFMVMTQEEVEQYCHDHSDCSALLAVRRPQGYVLQAVGNGFDPSSPADGG